MSESLSDRMRVDSALLSRRRGIRYERTGVRILAFTSERYMRDDIRVREMRNMIRIVRET